MSGYTEKLNNLARGNDTIDTLKGAILENLDGGGGADLSAYYTKTETNETFIKKTDGNTIVADLAPKSGLYKDVTTAVDLETQCQSLETKVNAAATKTELTAAVDSSTNLMVLDPSTAIQETLDSALANIYVAPSRMSEQDMDMMSKKVAKELVNNPDNLKLIVKSVTDMITKTK